MKQSLGELAMFGGTPSFVHPLHVGRPNLPPFVSLAKRMQKIFERGWLSNRGPEVQEFEREVARIAGVQHCVAVCNATVGLEVASRALGMTGEVIVPSFTFVATAHALAWQGATPVFCDIDPLTHTIDPGQIEALITPRTTGIIGVHTWGRICDVEALAEIARRRRIRLVFDAAHAFACSRQGRAVGGFGDAEVFSFHATKFLNAFEGGAVVTNDAALAERVRLMTNFGFQDYDHVVSVGINGKMTEASAAMGLASLESMQDVLACNRRNYEAYVKELAGLPGIAVFAHDQQDLPNLQYVVLEVTEEHAGLHRDVLLEVLHSENVLARRYFYPGVHRMEPYRSAWRTTTSLPHTEALTERVLVLPTGRSVTPADIGRICALVRLCVTNGDELSRRLPRDKLIVARNLK